MVSAITRSPAYLADNPATPSSILVANQPEPPPPTASPSQIILAQDSSINSQRQPAQAAANTEQHSSGTALNRFFGGLKVLGGAAEAIAGTAFGIATWETGVGAVAGGVVAVHGADTVQAGLHQLFTGKNQETLTQQGITAGAEHLGASPKTAETIGTVADLGIGIVGGGGAAFGVGKVAIAAARTGETAEAASLLSRTGEAGEVLTEGSTAAHAAEAGSSAASSLNRVSEIRSALRVGKGRNIAFADFNIDGETGELIGVSGKNAPKGTAGLPTSPRLQPTVAPAENGFLRDADSEYKILEDLASKLSPDSEGTVNLFTERPACESCQGVIQQFERMFPKVKVNVTDGGPRQ